MKSTFALLLVLFAVGCATQSEVRRRSDLMSYLYPDSGTAPKPQPERAHMQRPLRLGIAFVPTTEGRPLMYEAGLPEARYDPNPVVARQNEKKLLDVVRKTFEGRDWVREIVIIPSTYLTPHGGCENLDQVAQMYGVDVVALASVAQIHYVNEGRIAYLSIIGSY